MKKSCCRCHVEKELIDFSRDSHVKSGYKGACKQCINRDSEEYRLAHAKETSQRGIAWYHENKQYRREYERFKRHGGEFAFKGRKIRNHTEVKQETRDYQKAHKKERAAKNRERRKTDVCFRVVSNLRTRINNALKGKTKSAITQALLGCTVEQFKKWIEQHFLLNMNWSNYGQGDFCWQIDHHYPCDMFDLTDPEQQKQCFHYTNMFPLWQKDNLSKLATVPEPRDYQI